MMTISCISLKITRTVDINSNGLILIAPVFAVHFMDQCLRCRHRSPGAARSAPRDQGVGQGGVCDLGGAGDRRKQLHPRLQGRLVQARYRNSLFST